MKIKVKGIVWNISENSMKCDVPLDVTIESDYDLDTGDILEWLSNEYKTTAVQYSNIEYEDETVKDLDGMVCGNGSEFCIG